MNREIEQTAEAIYVAAARRHPTGATRWEGLYPNQQEPWVAIAEGLAADGWVLRRADEVSG